MCGPQVIRIASDQGEISIETEDPDVQVEILKDGKLVRVVDTKTDQSFSIRSGNYEFRAAPASGSETGVTFDVTPKQLVMNRGQQQIVKVTKNLAGQDAQSQHAETSSAEDPDALIYDGKNFEQWMRIAKTDRSPKNFVNAIRACGALASSPDEQKMLFEIIDSAARRHGNNILLGEDEKVMKAMLAAIWQHPPELAADFVQRQLQSGNTRSKQFCIWVLGSIGMDSVTCPNKSDFDLAFASRANELLPIAVNKDQNLSSTLIGACLNVSAQELKKLNPTIQATTERLYWEQAQVKDSQAIDRLGELAAHVRLEDQKIVSHLVERYKKTKWQAVPTSSPAFRALTYSALQNYNYSAVQPITDWHDEVRAKFFAEVLEQELSQAAVEHRFQPITVRPTNNQMWGYSNNPLQLIYESQECLNAILHKLNNEQRKSIRDRLVKIQKDLPTEIKNWSPPNVEKLGNDIEHNLKALIAKCDGGEEPVFIGIQEAKGSVTGFGGGGGGGGVFGGGGFGGGVF